MKMMIFALLCVAASASAAIMAHGSGFFPVIVQVFDSKSGSPIPGATVRLEGLSEYRESELDPNKVTKVLPDTLGKPVFTDEKGIAVVFYYGRWSAFTAEGKSTYVKAFHGTIVVVHARKEIFRSKLTDWVKENDFTCGEDSAPWVVVPFPPEIKKAGEAADLMPH